MKYSTLSPLVSLASIPVSPYFLPYFPSCFITNKSQFLAGDSWSADCFGLCVIFGETKLWLSYVDIYLTKENWSVMAEEFIAMNSAFKTVRLAPYFN
jgi:hypothetical protein